MTTFEIIIVLVILYIPMVVFTMQTYKYNANKESLSAVEILLCILLAWLAPASFAAYIHRCITKFLDEH